MSSHRKLLSLASMGGFIIGTLLAQGACVPCQCPEISWPMPQDGQFSVDTIMQYEEGGLSQSLDWEESSWQDVAEGTIEVTPEQVTLIYTLESGSAVTATFDVLSKDDW